MSDLRGISRGSKTAAVVILVVLLQVIVVAVLGLGAITRDREEGARLAHDEADAKAATQASGTLLRAQAGLVGELEAEARVARNTGGLRNQAPTPWRLPFLDVFRVDAEGGVYAADGTLLYVPPEVIEIQEQAVDGDRLRKLEESIARLDSLTKNDPAEQPLRRQIVQEFRFATDGKGFGTAVAHALKLAEDAASPADVSPLDLLEPVRVAYETAAINDRPAAAKIPFSYVRARLDLIARKPGREAIADSLVALEHARDALSKIRELALPVARDFAAHPAPARVFPLRETGPEVVVVALAPLPRLASDRLRQCLLARLDRVALIGLVEGVAVTPTGAPVKAALREEPWASSDREYRLPLRRGDFDIALDVVVPVPAVARSAETTGPRETFYWTILVLAALGVTTAGVVLVRILRKEVHLARLKTDFVSNLSHELKTPLTSISMFVELLKDGRMTTDERSEALDVVGQESDRLQRIVSRMIDTARREDASTGYDLAPADLNVPVRAACERFRRIEKSPGLHLLVGLATDLPPVRLDRSAIDDALTNLLANAWKYRKGDEATIRVVTRRAGRRRVDLLVADDGIGIPRRERKRIFEMFYRADSFLSRNVPGTGLGLALVRTIVRIHRGKIRVDGAPGAGTTFRLRFPTAKGKGTSTPGPARPPTAREPASKASSAVESPGS
jgi:signal transduction histidine kinase